MYATNYAVEEEYLVGWACTCTIPEFPHIRLIVIHHKKEYFVTPTMRVLVVGTYPLPWKFFQALHSRYSVTVKSLTQKPLRISGNKQHIVLIWAEKVSLLFVKKLLQTIEHRFPLAIPIVLGGGFCSKERAEILRAGARECLSHTISADEFVARIMLVCGERLDAPAHFQHKNFFFVYGEHIASCNNIRITLNKKEARLLEILLKAHPKIVPTSVLLSLVWSQSDPPLSNSLEVYMSRLRQKIEKPFGLQLFETVKGVGYRSHSPPNAPHSRKKRSTASSSVG